jgi:flavin reductase (DIM6/NTAB) family NADH-FMN oxidoreductase RutF
MLKYQNRISGSWNPDPMADGFQPPCCEPEFNRNEFYCVVKSLTLRKMKNLVRITQPIVYRLFNPQVPAILCSKNGTEIAAMPVNSCSSLSDSPPMVSVAIKKGMRTNRIVRSSSLFSINWLNYDNASSRKALLDLAKPAASKDTGDKLKENGVPYSLVRGSPILRDACAFAVCGVTKRISTGDHDLFLASVTEARAISDFVTDGYWRFESYKPILYLGSIRADPLTTIDLKAIKE